MRVELFPFQKEAVASLRVKADYALQGYAQTHTPQVVSLQAPTGSGKTVMMTAFIEGVLFGDDRHDENPNAVFVWLSDSPTLNEQSKDKIDTQSDKIRMGQTVIVEDASFDRETFEDGHIYFINTQKLSKAGNLGQKSDTREYTIWQTIQNTVEQKSDRLYFIIDEAHRGMQGEAGGKQTAIMQRFLKGWEKVGLKPMPVVIGMSATPQRFDKLVENLSSTVHKEVVKTEDVRASGLLKDRIIITFPKEEEKQDAIAVLAAATREWMDKCKHWRDYCTAQHYRNVNPVFLIQVKAGTSDGVVSETDLDAAVAKIAEVSGETFGEGQIVHTFGSVGALTLNGIAVKNVAPGEITDDRNIRVVFFKENLSTGWDCPRAETMMSFRVAEDYTYIAQLLGRMIRTPLQCHVNVDDSLNDVRLFLPYFDKDTVGKVIDELKSSECGEIPSVIESEEMGSEAYALWGVKTRIRKPVSDQHQLKLFPELPVFKPVEEEGDTDETGEPYQDVKPQQVPTPIIVTPIREVGTAARAEPIAADGPKLEQPALQLEIDRQDIIRRINQMGIVRYEVRTRKQHIRDYLTAALSLSALLTRTRICAGAGAEVRQDIVKMISGAIGEIRSGGRYEALAKQIREMRLESVAYDAFGMALRGVVQGELSLTSDTDVDRQLREADVALGRAGIVNEYGRRFATDEDEDGYKIDCIMFAKDETCMERVYAYAKEKFHKLDDEYRRYLVSKSEEVRREYDEIVASGDVVSKHNFILPETIQGFAAADGKTYGDHLYADEKGLARIKHGSSWEERLIAEEEEGADFVCWLRNPPKQKWSLCVPYTLDGEHRAMYPDFLVVRRDWSASSAFGYVVDILEPHNPALKDNLAKAQGLAKYVQEARQCGRIQLVREARSVGGFSKLRRLDLNKGTVRDKVLAATTNEELDHLFDTDGIVE